MTYEEFNKWMASIRDIEVRGSLVQAQAEYKRLLASDLSENQHATVLLGRACCFLCSAEPLSAVRVLADLRVEALDYTVQAVVNNVRAHSYHELGDYNRAIIEAQFAEALTMLVQESGADLLGEALARQGFAEAELGRFRLAAKHLFQAKELPLETSIRTSVQDYVTKFQLESYI